MNWLPIEVAPKDGRPFLVKDNLGLNGTGRWDKYRNQYLFTDFNGEQMDGRWVKQFKPLED